MTTFVQAGSAAGILFLPRDVVGPVPVKDGPFRDTEVLSLPDWQVAELDDANDLLDIVRAARRRRAATDAIEYQAIARLAQLRAAEGEERARYVPDEVALESRIGTGAAAHRVATAEALVNRMPMVLAAMRDGEFEGYLASRLTDATQALCDADAREVDRQLAGKLAAGRVDGNDPKNVRDACRRLVVKVDPDAATRKARIARCERKIQLMPGEDTMARIIADLPAEVAASASIASPADYVTTATNAPSTNSGPTSSVTCSPAAIPTAASPAAASPAAPTQVVLRAPWSTSTCPSTPPWPCATTAPSSPATGRYPGRSPATS